MAWGVNTPGSESAGGGYGRGGDGSGNGGGGDGSGNGSGGDGSGNGCGVCGRGNRRRDSAFFLSVGCVRLDGHDPSSLLCNEDSIFGLAWVLSSEM